MIIAPQPGPQTQSLIASEFEILMGGARYVGKSWAQQMFFLKGNPDRPQAGLKDADTSYIFHPFYRALALRRNYDDMTSWISKAIQMYESSSIGGKWFDSKRTFKFPHPVSGSLDDGAQILVGHLAEEGAFRKYIGHEYHRIGVEELTFIPTLQLYLGVITSCRTTLPELRPQVFNTSNPEGPGLQWVKKRFMTDPVTGKRVNPNTTIVDKVRNPITGKEETVTRIYIPGTIRDNKLGMIADPHYAARLAALPEGLRRAYLDGDWDVMAGDVFFSEFRPAEPLSGEPANAFHCVTSDSVTVQPWDVRWAACDWGFNHPAAFYWCVKAEADRRIYFYRELVSRFMGSYDLGVTFARQSLPDLAGMDPPVMNLWMSPDAFSNRDASKDGDDTSIVARFAQGVRSVLGGQSVYVPETQELLDAGVPRDEAEDFFYRKALAEKANIVIRRAPNQRVAGWNYMRELLSFRDQELGLKAFDREYARQILQEPDGLARYFKYIDAHQKLATRPELPRMRIFSDRCPRLIEGIQRATFADDLTDLRKVDADPQTGLGGDDEIDCARYACLGFQKMQTVVPPTVQRQRKVQDLQERYGGTPLMQQALDKLDQDSRYNKSATQGISLHRQATHPARKYDGNWQNQKLLRDRQEAQSNWFWSSFADIRSKLD